MVGTDARMRVSSVMVLPSSGTLRSQRTRTRLPAMSAGLRSLMDFLVVAAAVAMRTVGTGAAGAVTRREGATKVLAERETTDTAAVWRVVARRGAAQGTKPVTMVKGWLVWMWGMRSDQEWGVGKPMGERSGGETGVGAGRVYRRGEGMVGLGTGEQYEWRMRREVGHLWWLTARESALEIKGCAPVRGGNVNLGGNAWERWPSIPKEPMRSANGTGFINTSNETAPGVWRRANRVKKVILSDSSPLPAPAVEHKTKLTPVLHVLRWGELVLVQHALSSMPPCTTMIGYINFTRVELGIPCEHLCMLVGDVTTFTTLSTV